MNTNPETSQPAVHSSRLELMKMNYQNLQTSTWECHKIFWTMTSIILPLSFVLPGLFLNHVPSLPAATAILFLVVIAAIITFWFVG